MTTAAHYAGATLPRFKLQNYASYATFYIQQYTGTLYIEQHNDDGDVVFKSDDGNGGVTEYFWLDGGEATHDGSATTALYTIFPDKSKIALGAGKDLELYHDGSNSFIEN